MNERIEALKKLATKEAMGWYVLDADMFAELIVQECIDNLSWHGHDEAVQQLYWLRENKLGMK